VPRQRLDAFFADSEAFLDEALASSFDPVSQQTPGFNPPSMVNSLNREPGPTTCLFHCLAGGDADHLHIGSP
jgi:hypothetical protein